jgi:hypothetical protein
VKIETVGDLKEALEEFDDALPLRVAFQPSWPLAAEVANVRAINPADEDASGTVVGRPDRPVVWIAASSSIPYAEDPYAPRNAWEES